jgi:antitoxin component YwqK of YwqJK toxin-antitoxin module
MEYYFKYKRFEETYIYADNKVDTQQFFDNLIKDGWQIIYYNEEKFKTLSHIPSGSNIPNTIDNLKITVIAGKKQKML